MAQIVVEHHFIYLSHERIRWKSRRSFGRTRQVRLQIDDYTLERGLEKIEFICLDDFAMGVQLHTIHPSRQGAERFFFCCKFNRLDYFIVNGF